jgi:type IV pilus assembly protein PilC
LPVFQYTARNEEGRLIRETIAFHDELALRSHLRKNNLYVLEVAERRKARLKLNRGVRLGDLVIMTRQLRTMVKAGMPLVTGLEALADQTTNSRLNEVLTEVGRAVGNGRTLAAALEDYPNIFPEMLVTLVRAGEEGGRLPESLDEASRQLELQMEVRQKLISALMYPMFTLFATFGTVAVMIIFIVPVFAKIYKDLHASLPAITLLLVQISDIVVNQGWIVVLVLVTAIVALRRYNKTPEGRLRIDGLKLKIPLVGSLFRKSASANLTGSLAGLMDSGLPLIQALQTSARACGNEVMADAARIAARNVTLGRRLSDELETSGQFPTMVVRMVAVAEDVGTLPAVLREISASYIEEVEYAIRRIMAVIEPIMILTVGGIVGFVLVALYYPIFNLGNVFLEGG